MLFNSYAFAILVIVTFAVYYCRLWPRGQVIVLIVSSLVFYGYSQPYLLILLSVSASINAVASYWVHFDDDNKKKRLYALAGVSFNLLVLAFFKYNKLLDGLFVTNDTIQFLVTLPLPIGISFYTFQGISLVLDTYQHNTDRQVHIHRNFLRHFRDTFFFVTYFPQLVAGPIVKAHYFFPQIGDKRLKDVDWNTVFKALVTGYFLKSVVADNLKEQTFWIAAPYFETQASLTLVTMLFGYSMQIFADFAGYSLIAIGIAGLFGYRLPINFNYPYIASSIADFWRRWHISLSTWLRDYLYFSLGGNKKGRARTYINLLTVMGLGGLWHGAAVSYAVWGLWHGVGLVIERFFRNLGYVRIKPGVISTSIRIILVFSFVSFGWLLFKLTNFPDAVNYLRAMRDNTAIAPRYVILINIVIYSLPVFVYHLLYLAKQAKHPIAGIVAKSQHYFYGTMIFLILVNGGIPGEFIYFQF